ncbi:MAG: SPASM domain-containing protein [Candidatus Helarchaeota archaeon]
MDEIEINDIIEYFNSPELTKNQYCDSAQKNMMIDLYGEVQLCFNMKGTLNKSLGNVKFNTLRELWESEAAELLRQEMKNCRYSCGILNCHRRRDYH